MPDLFSGNEPKPGFWHMPEEKGLRPEIKVLEVNP
jgi:hypothetical protein